MKARIKSRFASAKETARVLGVSESRFKVLERLAHSDSTVKFKSATLSRSVGFVVATASHVTAIFAAGGSRGEAL
jgi:hypothetical protein